MNKPELYSKSILSLRKDYDYMLQKYFHHVNWRSDGGDVVLDVGCGPGNITEYILLSYMPPTIKKIVGVDISKEMIQYATETYTNPKFEFKVLDIGTKCLEKDMENCFDHIMSFYCLHWVQDQRQGYKNIYKMLKPGGNLFFSSVVSHPLFDVFEILAKKNRWAQYMTDFEKYKLPFGDRISPDNDLKIFLEETGFDVKVCTCESRSLTFENEKCLADFVTSASPYLDRLPENLKKEYLEDHINEIKKMNFVGNINEGVTNPYKIFVVYATKSV